jgi:hypothetical protein
MTSRRQFLFDCSTAVAGLALVPMSAVRLTAMSDGGFQSLAQMSYPVLAGQINTVFRVRLSPLRAVELKLLKAPLAPPTPITQGKRLPGDAGNEKFSLIFSGPKDPLIEPAIHRFEHGQLGRFDMYVGQIGTQDNNGSVRYEAGFNRPVPATATFKNLNLT